MTLKHFIAMSGSHGCLPDHCQSYTTLASAVDDLTELFGLGRTRRARLKAELYLELTPTFEEDEFGAEYCEIHTCECATPEVHNDN